MFIQPCFIINNKERREKLQSLGVRYDGYYGVDNKFILTGYGPYDNFYDTVDNPPISVNYHTKNDGYQSFEYLNCADNEELFFALATLRDDTSINQYYWFNDRLFKCEGLEFDRVLMRSSNAREWTATLYSHYNNNKFYGCGMCCDQCIPYEHNEHLRGTTNDCDEYYKTWK